MTPAAYAPFFRRMESELLSDDELIERDWRDRAAAVLPGGTSTGSKRAAALYGDATLMLPTHFEQAAGCRIRTVGGRTLVDCTMALGAVALGYAEPAVTRRVCDAVAGGHVAGLAHPLEVAVAERLCDVIPCAEQVRFLKSGAEAVSAAVRIARTATGRRTVIACGYFGWHDWASDAAGVPAGARADVRVVPFDDVAALEQAAAQPGDGGGLAAIVLEPVIERLPDERWIRRARELCDATGAVLVFDEIKTAFRLRTGGYQELSGIEPDLATLGKAMANGFPLAAVVGRAAVMEAAEETWISSTLAGESASLAAASAVLDWHEEHDVCAILATAGAGMRTAVARAVTASGVRGVAVAGLDPMWLIRVDTPRRESRLLELAVEQGVLLKRGAYNFASLAHDDDTIAEIEAAVSTALVTLRDEDAA